MKDIFTSLGDDSNEKPLIKKQERITFDSETESDFFSYKEPDYEDFDSGRINFSDKSSSFGQDYKSENNIYLPEDFFDVSSSSESQLDKDIDNYPGYDEHGEQPFYDIPHESTADESDRPKRQPRVRNEKKKNGLKKKAVLTIICIILVLAIAVPGYAFLLCSKTDYQPDTHKANEYISDSELISDDNIYNILILGTDKRETQDNYRSDTMILVSLDKNTKKLKMTSFLRDSYVYIPAKGFSTKLNAACAYGGPQMVIDTIEYNFKVRIDKYVMIDFDIFKQIIHDLGGVTLTMSEEEAACIRRESGYPCKAGTHTYKAKIALWYARIRHIDSDFKRTDRQRKVIAAVIDKIKHSTPKKINTMLNNSLPMIQGDISSAEMFKLGFSALPFLSYESEELQIPAAGTWSNAYVGGQAVLRMDIDKNTALLHEFIYEK